MSELITVIVPVYKVEKYIDKCVNSIVNQTYRDLEIILVDDGSPDNCGVLCDDYARRDKRIRVIHKENGGLSSARNAALDIMTGAWVVCVDSDDYIHHDMVQRLYDAAVNNSAHISICSHYEIHGDKLSITERIDDEVRIWDNMTALHKLVDDEEVKSYAWGKLYRSDLFEGVRYPVGRNYEDVATTYYLFDKAERIVKIPEYLYFYLQRNDSISFNDSTSAWHKGCHATCLGQEERADYFKKKRYCNLYDVAMAKLLPYLYSDIMSGYSINAYADIRATKKYLTEKKKELLKNPLISDNDKRILPIYLKDEKTFKLYTEAKEIYKRIVHYSRRVRIRIRPDKGHYDFTLAPGKSKRIICFELPCFDNLGDHAIAYVTEQIVRDICQKNQDYQYFIADGWDIDNAIITLRGELGPDDVIICQGGGNLGNLYNFAESIRRKVLKAYKDNRIIIMPQTFYYTDDDEGKRELAKDKNVISSCKKLTLFARDAKSYELMKANFNCEVLQLHDIVSMYDATYLCGKNRNGYLLCLRSDKEGNLSASDKTAILETCEKNSEKVIVTDTCIHYDVDPGDRRDILEKKLSLFASAKMVITDRLHGMIFSLITGTPCIVIGNNHHKVYETYKTFKDCPYIKFISTIDEIEESMTALNSTDMSIGQMDLSSDIDLLTSKCINIRNFKKGEEMNQKLSVIVPVYNVENELDRCLKSIVSQKYKDLEIILVDDGSTDNSGKKCDEWKEQDSRIKVIHQPNGGLSHARNTGLNECTGDFVAFVDSDDYIDENMYQIMVKALDDQDADVVICHKQEFFTEIKKVDNSEYIIESVWDRNELLKSWLYQTDLINYAWNKVYKKELIADYRFTKGLVGCEDWDFNLDVLTGVNKVVVISNELYFYYQREGSITHKENDDSFYMGLANAYVKQSNNFSKVGEAAIALDNTSYCLNRLARYSLRKEFDNRRNVKNHIVSEFRKLYRQNKRDIHKLKDKNKIRLAYYAYPVYSALVK